MKRSTLFAGIFLLSFCVSAEQGGFDAGKTPPPQQKEDAGYKGSEDTGETPVTLIKDFRQGGYATLEGYIVKKVKDNTYLFRDSSGTVHINASESAFKGKTFSAEDKIRVSGKVFGKGNNTRMEISRIDEP